LRLRDFSVLNQWAPSAGKAQRKLLRENNEQ